MTHQYRAMRLNELWICPEMRCPWLSTVLVVGPFEEEEDGISIHNNVVKVKVQQTQVLEQVLFVISLAITGP